MSDDASGKVVLTPDEVDTHLDGEMAGIIRETFTVDERMSWDTMPITVVQYLRSATAPSGVATWPVVLHQLGNVHEALGFLIAMLNPDPPEAATAPLAVLRDDGEGYLGCAVAVEMYDQPLSREESTKRWGDRPITEIPGTEEVRMIRGMTSWNRRWMMMRVRGTQGAADSAAVVMDVERGDDESHPVTALNILVERLNEAFGNAYQRRAS